MHSGQLKHTLTGSDCYVRCLQTRSASVSASWREFSSSPDDPTVHHAVRAAPGRLYFSFLWSALWKTGCSVFHTLCPQIFALLFCPIYRTELSWFELHKSGLNLLLSASCLVLFISLLLFPLTRPPLCLVSFPHHSCFGNNRLLSGRGKLLLLLLQLAVFFDWVKERFSLVIWSFSLLSLSLSISLYLSICVCVYVLTCVHVCRCVCVCVCVWGRAHIKDGTIKHKTLIKKKGN